MLRRTLTKVSSCLISLVMSSLSTRLLLAHSTEEQVRMKTTRNVTRPSMVVRNVGIVIAGAFDDINGQLCCGILENDDPAALVILGDSVSALTTTVSTLSLSLSRCLIDLFFSFYYCYYCRLIGYGCFFMNYRSYLAGNSHRHRQPFQNNLFPPTSAYFSRPCTCPHSVTRLYHVGTSVCTSKCTYLAADPSTNLMRQYFGPKQTISNSPHQSNLAMIYTRAMNAMDFF